MSKLLEWKYHIRAFPPRGGIVLFCRVQLSTWISWTTIHKMLLQWRVRVLNQDLLGAHIVIADQTKAFEYLFQHGAQFGEAQPEAHILFCKICIYSRVPCYRCMLIRLAIVHWFFYVWMQVLRILQIHDPRSSNWFTCASTDVWPYAYVTAPPPRPKFTPWELLLSWEWVFTCQ